MKKIVITGPESTGKSTLSYDLGFFFNAPVIEEFAVQYLTKTNSKYTYKDLLKIARGQINIEENVINSLSPDLLICDTDLLTIKIWSKVKYNKVNRWIMKTIRNRHYDHYLLCYPDIPWEYNPLRENPDDREQLFELYEKELKKYKKSYTIIKGLEQSRLNIAIEAIHNLLLLK